MRVRVWSKERPKRLDRPELLEWAYRLIDGQSYDAKLIPPPLETSQKDGGCESDLGQYLLPHIVALGKLPEHPGRPSAVKSARESGSISRESLEKPLNQAMLLHSFANHELLAIEAMALILLRFPETPGGFQQGLIQTIREEQKHFQLYRNRIRAFGFDFGDFGINEYLWNICRTASSPLEFVTLMSLTFEQANLDYALYFKNIFENLGDVETAEILATVYRDETKHVHHGLVWFNQWRPQQKSDWDEYQDILVEPLSPARAKGLGFQPDIRLKLGFSPRYVKELSIYRQSKGRPGDVWWFNPSAEAELQNGRRTFQPNAAMQALTADLSPLMMLLAKKDDIVMVETKPSSDYLVFLENLGFMLPEFISDPAILSGRKLGFLKPWGVTPRSHHMPKIWGLDLKASSCEPSMHPIICRKSWSKQVYLEWTGKIFLDTPIGTVCRTLEDLQLQADHIFKEHDSLVVKADFNCSGRGRKKLRKGQPLLDQEQGWLEKQLNSDGFLTLEPWVDKVVDMSTQILVQDEVAGDRVGFPKIKILGITRFMTDDHGQYLGHFLGDQTIESPPDFWRFYHEKGYGDQLKQAAIFVGEKLHKQGYRGPAGIDSLVFRSKGSLQLYPIVEVNTRWTMGSLALILNKKIPRDVPAKWLHISLKMINKMGYFHFSHFVKDIDQRAPLVADKSIIRSGVVPTTDPTQATCQLSLLLVGKALEAYTSLRGAYSVKPSR